MLYCLVSLYIVNPWMAVVAHGKKCGYSGSKSMPIAKPARFALQLCCWFFFLVIMLRKLIRALGVGLALLVPFAFFVIVVCAAVLAAFPWLASVVPLIHQAELIAQVAVIPARQEQSLPLRLGFPRHRSPRLRPGQTSWQPGQTHRRRVHCWLQ